MTLQLRLWQGDGTRLDGEPRVVLTVRESRRARQLILQALPPRTVEVVVPRGVRAEVVQRFIREHRDWIDRAGAELVASYPEFDLNPAVIDLPAIGTRVAVNYRHAQDTDGSRYRYVADELTLFGGADRAIRYPVLLRRWLLAQARQCLKPWLARVSAEIGLKPRSVQVRLQKTRWGSCSSRGSISINAALLLVPPDLVRYLFVHELCHLVHLSHSRRYWQTVRRHEPDYRNLDRRLAATWRSLPAWLFALAHGSES